ncbi:MAG: serine hydroxymethyltransferase [Rickettsiaceae bacterium]|nr:serine hydroxymethyltransferase [Rickettsiaceae bacterium]
MIKKLSAQDEEIFRIIEKEKFRQINNIELIASENYVSKAVLEAAGSILTNKYAEGYPAKRYYNGCEYVDEIENIAISRLKRLFKCEFANVQPHSGSSANQAVFLSLLSPGDTILSMSLDCGGHLTHGSSANLSGKWFNAIHYGVRQKDGLIDYEDVMRKALEHKPKLIICGYSAYPRIIDFALFREIADKVGAYLLADIAHIAGLVAVGEHPDPLPYAHIATSTTHKTLRGPRGGIIMTNYEDLAKKINSAIFPGLQGGPLMHIIAAKAVAFKEALSEEYKDYIKNVCTNAKFFASQLTQHGFSLQTGGTDNHLVLVDLRPQNITGKLASNILDEAGITCNKNSIPFDTTSSFITSGIRMGTAACTTRGFKENEWIEITSMISEILKSAEDDNIAELIAATKKKVEKLCSNFPIY